MEEVSEVPAVGSAVCDGAAAAGFAGLRSLSACAAMAGERRVRLSRNARIAAEILSVSYTHLDVYKRQQLQYPERQLRVSIPSRCGM